jgi:hypothetical protein
VAKLENVDSISTWTKLVRDVSDDQYGRQHSDERFVALVRMFRYVVVVLVLARLPRSELGTNLGHTAKAKGSERHGGPYSPISRRTGPLVGTGWCGLGISEAQSGPPSMRGTCTHIHPSKSKDTSRGLGWCGGRRQCGTR